MHAPQEAFRQAPSSTGRPRGCNLECGQMVVLASCIGYPLHAPCSAEAAAAAGLQKKQRAAQGKVFPTV